VEKICINCNEINLEEAMFCKKCGSKLPTLKEIEASLNEEKRIAEEKFKQQVEASKQKHDTISQAKRDKGAVIVQGSDIPPSTNETPPQERLTPLSKKEKDSVKEQEKYNAIQKMRGDAKPKLAQVDRNKRDDDPLNGENKRGSNIVLIIVIGLVILLGGGYFGLQQFGLLDQIKEKIVSGASSIKERIEHNPNEVQNIPDVFIDYGTKLMWEDGIKTVDSARSWSEANSYCESLELGGFKDWRLPLKDELEGIVDTDNSPTIKKGFKNIKPNNYWSIKMGASNSLAWYVFFQSGEVYHASVDDYNNVRCVRNK